MLPKGTRFSIETFPNKTLVKRIEISSGIGLTRSLTIHSQKLQKVN